MAGVSEHYDQLLAPYYSWMSGGAKLKFEENRKFFQAHAIRPALSGTAVDLGAGSGFQSIPLSKAGFKVIAIDGCRELLLELKAYAQETSIVAVEDELLNFAAHISGKVELIVCMGDTLTHLKSLDEVRFLLQEARRSLENNGRLILEFRDLTLELKSLDRFIPVRSDSNRIFTCFLEYEKKHVKVHDIVYVKAENRWVMKKSWFRKLRIPPQWMRDSLQSAGFATEYLDISNGVVTILARNPIDESA